MEISSSNSLVIYDRQDKVSIKPAGKIGKNSVHNRQQDSHYRRSSNTSAADAKGIYYTYSLNNSLEFMKAGYMGVFIDTYA